MTVGDYDWSVQSRDRKVKVLRSDLQEDSKILSDYSDLWGLDFNNTHFRFQTKNIGPKHAALSDVVR